MEKARLGRSLSVKVSQEHLVSGVEELVFELLGPIFDLDTGVRVHGILGCVISVAELQL